MCVPWSGSVLPFTAAYGYNGTIGVQIIKYRILQIENLTTYISYHYLKRTLWYKFMFYFAFYHLTQFGYLKIYKNIFRCEEIFKIMTLNTHRFS